MMWSMSSQHRDDPLTVRVPAELKAAATAELHERGGLHMRAFVAAALEALRADPEATLRHLAAHWPDDKPRGRPRHAESTDQG